MMNSLYTAWSCKLRSIPVYLHKIVSSIHCLRILKLRINLVNCFCFGQDIMSVHLPVAVDVFISALWQDNNTAKLLAWYDMTFPQPDTWSVSVFLWLVTTVCQRDSICPCFAPHKSRDILYHPVWIHSKVRTSQQYFIRHLEPARKGLKDWRCSPSFLPKNDWVSWKSKVLPRTGIYLLFFPFCIRNHLLLFLLLLHLLRILLLELKAM